jgi:hypothetical protein
MAISELALRLKTATRSMLGCNVVSVLHMFEELRVNCINRDKRRLQACTIYNSVRELHRCTTNELKVMLPDRFGAKMNGAAACTSSCEETWHKQVKVIAGACAYCDRRKCGFMRTGRRSRAESERRVVAGMCGKDALGSIR